MSYAQLTEWDWFVNTQKPFEKVIQEHKWL